MEHRPVRDLLLDLQRVSPPRVGLPQLVIVKAPLCRGGIYHDATCTYLIQSGQVSGIKTIAALNQMSTESASNLSDPESQKKTKRELRLGERVLVRGSLENRRSLTNCTALCCNLLESITSLWISI